MTLSTALKLGRVSNLPTVWTNALAGLVLAVAVFDIIQAVTIALAMSLFYLGGMFLNDAYDADFDREHRSDRPIARGEVTERTVFVAGYGLLAAGLILLALAGFSGAGPLGPLLAGLALGASIVGYDKFHKNNPLSPLFMGVCRMLVYIGAGVTVAWALPLPLLLGALMLLAHLIGLTFAAKQEHLGRLDTLWPLGFLALPALYGLWVAWGNPLALMFVAIHVIWVLVALRFLMRRGPGDIPRGVVSLIAGISLLDAMLIANAGMPALALVAIACFGLTLALQKVVSGT